MVRLDGPVQQLVCPLTSAPSASSLLLGSAYCRGRQGSGSWDGSFNRWIAQWTACWLVSKGGAHIHHTIHGFIYLQCIYHRNQSNVGKYTIHGWYIVLVWHSEGAASFLTQEAQVLAMQTSCTTLRTYHVGQNPADPFGMVVHKT